MNYLFISVTIEKERLGTLVSSFSSCSSKFTTHRWMDRWLLVQLTVLEIDMCLQCALYETFKASRLIWFGWYTYLPY